MQSEEMQYNLWQSQHKPTASSSPCRERPVSRADGSRTNLSQQYHISDLDHKGFLCFRRYTTSGMGKHGLSTILSRCDLLRPVNFPNDLWLNSLFALQGFKKSRN